VEELSSITRLWDPFGENWNETQYRGRYSKFDNVDGTPSDCDICLDFTLYSDIYGNYTIDMFWTYDSEQLVGNGGS